MQRSRSRTSKSSMSQPATVQPAPSSSATIALPSPPSAPVTSALIAVPVLGGDVGRVLVPVPSARIVVEVAGRLDRIHRVADPMDRQHLVHEGAVGAIDREALAVVGPVVFLLHHRVPVLALVPAVPP